MMEANSVVREQIKARTEDRLNVLRARLRKSQNQRRNTGEGWSFAEQLIRELEARIERYEAEETRNRAEAQTREAAAAQAAVEAQAREEAAAQAAAAQARLQAEEARAQAEQARIESEQAVAVQDRLGDMETRLRAAEEQRRQAESRLRMEIEARTLAEQQVRKLESELVLCQKARHEADRVRVEAAAQALQEAEAIARRAFALAVEATQPGGGYRFVDDPTPRILAGPTIAQRLLDSLGVPFKNPMN
jgi:hypothetical protein